ncbi:DUF2059 domain-containing protein [Phaeovulum sp. NW3]|uniref:DUF2059 domain-containing protein n=1 Tax=Phaeovulum sp. NW3 TaxID=2934933 RepID=UPI0020213BF2|nr:DUF2059 domain-containing protein [Phaeovulum sp. NW3]MCL7464095.1 DUF2059 domain-containing protein [Phaeovulum sp. NW3]
MLSAVLSRTVSRCGILMLALLVLAAPARADAAQIARLLQTEALFEILRDEAVVYGDELAEELFEQGPDPLWRGQVAAINAPDRLRPVFEAAFAAALGDLDLRPIEGFLGSDLGRRVITLEIETRRALLDRDLEEAARAAFDAALDQGDRRALAVRDFIDRADLIEPNVAGGLNANLAFYRAMAAGGAFPYAISEAEMLADVRAQEPEVRAEMAQWLSGYLFLAYHPLSDAELAAYGDFSASAPGRALMAAVFAGFDAVFVQVSRDLGAATARRLSGQDL